MTQTGAPPTTAWDEARDDQGRVRPQYAAVLAAIDAVGPAAAAAATARTAAGLGIAVGGGDTRRALAVDAVPRVLTASEWAPLAAGLAQRARMLEALLTHLPLDDEAIASSLYRERDLEDTAGTLPGPPLAVVGFDVVRRPDGGFALLEENLLTPGHAAVPAARDAVGLWRAVPDPPLAVHEPVRRLLREALGLDRDPDDAVILADAPGDGASWETRWLARFLDVPVVAPSELTVGGRRLLRRAGGRVVRTVWYRTAEDRLRDDDGALTALGEVLLAPLLAGTVRVVNRPGCGVADDKRLLARAGELVRELLREAPLLDVVPTYDLAAPAAIEAALARAEHLVLKPRHGAGGRGVVIGPRAEATQLDAVRAKVRREPGGWVAQEHVPLSIHPTAHDGALVGRPVDLRAFAIRGRNGWKVVPGGVSRYPTAPGATVVNTSAGGGIKDVWVLRADPATGSRP